MWNPDVQDLHIPERECCRVSDWMNTAVLCGNGSMESGEWMSLSVQSNVSHSSSIKVKDSGDRAERKRRTVRTMSTVTAECACAGQVQTRSDSARQSQHKSFSRRFSKISQLWKRPLLILNVLVGAFEKVRLKLYPAPRTVSRVTKT